MESVVFSDRGVVTAFERIRQLHDVTAGSPLAGAEEAVCHGDLSPWNTVYDDRRAIWLIEWTTPLCRHRALQFG